MADVQQGRLSAITSKALKPANQKEARSVLAELRAWGQDEPAIAELVGEGGALCDFIVAALSLSPFLRDIARLSPRLLGSAVSESIPALLSDIVGKAENCWRGTTEAEVMTGLRTAKRHSAFLIALADLSGLFDGRQTTAWLSKLAEASVTAAINHLLLVAHDSGKLNLAHLDDPSRDSGLIVLGMGKLGGEELNYSSDIDLVIFYEPDASMILDRDEAPETFARILRRLIRILQDRTGDGYVFRTDLRLRPDPGSTPLAIPVEAALLYYEGRGQNWERAAFIKARPIAGDRVAGARFLKEMVPFIFRKYLDYAAIADIHSIKRQIHAHRGHETIAVKGHNIKLGRGGIREIEFFAQTQQLIAGGRMPDLRVKPTEAALGALEAARWIDAETRDELVEAYWFLRMVEHRIQMVHDEQSHSLPDSEAELRRIAYLSGFESIEAFSSALVSRLKTVERRYARLFEQEERLSAGDGNLVFTGQKDDPDTLETLRKLGFSRPEDIARTVRSWHYGRYRATQSVEARERLTELMPELLRIFGRARYADEALLRFDQFIAGLPAGIQLFSLLSSNASLLSLIATIMSSAPKLAGIIAAKPHVFDGMLDPGLISELPTRDYLSARLSAFLSGTTHFEDILDRLRIFAFEQRFLIGIRLLTGAIGAREAALAFTDLADLVISRALDAVVADIEAAHGTFPGGRVAVVGLGKLGSREMTAGSDVDLILLYDHDSDALESTGPKPIDAGRYFTRLTQRLIAALSAPTAEGVLYEVDMRLRPSGNKGPVATRINAFEKYQLTEAWTWEQMALTRARLIAGNASLSDEAQGLMERIIATPRERSKVAADVAEMRSMIDKEKPPKNIWDIKLIPGGIVDVEFCAQYMALVATDRAGAERPTGTAEVLAALGPAFLGSDDLDALRNALALYERISQVVRLCIDGAFDPAEAPDGLKEFMCEITDMPDIRVLESEIRQQSQSVRRIFKALVR